MAKVSFSISKPQSSVRKSPSLPAAGEQEEESRESITIFDASEAPPSRPRKTRIIPPMPNQWAPFSNGNPQFTAAAASVEEQESSNALSYGLILHRSSSSSSNSSNNNDDAHVEPNPNLMPSSDTDPSLIKLWEDLKMLPDSTGFDEYEDMPVEEFGRALLAGYGWVEGMGIGRNAKEDVKVAECKQRTSGEGLGFRSNPLRN